MILLYALLAPLSGHTTAEHRAERAQVELSAVTAVGILGTVVAHSRTRSQTLRPYFERRFSAAFPLASLAPIRSVRTLLRIKQSWLQ